MVSLLLVFLCFLVFFLLLFVNLWRLLRKEFVVILSVFF